MHKISIFIMVLLFPLALIAVDDSKFIDLEPAIPVDKNNSTKPPYGDLFVPFAERNMVELERLFKSGIDVDLIDGKKDITLFFKSSALGDTEMMAFLIKSGADVEKKDKNGMTPLMISLFSRNLDAVKLLLDNKAKVNEVNKVGVSALHFSVESSSVPLINFLLLNGADINLKDNNGYSVIHKAASTRDAAVVDFLIKSGVDVELKDDKHGLSLLQMAVALHNDELVEHLLKNVGVDANSTAKNGMAALHHVAASGQYAVAVLLIKNGAKGNLKDKDGKVPLDYAREAANAKMITLLAGEGVIEEIK